MPENETMLPVATLDRLLPMHMRLAGDGIIVGAGPAIRRLAGERMQEGMRFFDLFSIERPKNCGEMSDLLDCAGARLSLRFQAGRKVSLRGHIVPAGTPDCDECGAIVDLALDLRELADLGGAPMTAADFSPTDPTLDMLYLIEAKTLAMDETLRLIDRLQGDRARAEQQAFTDTLTGLRNRRALDLLLNRYVQEGQSFAMFVIDLDFFKKVNDTYGHIAGDVVLCAVAERLGKVVRAADCVARVGGDEFVVLLPGLTIEDELTAIANRLIEEIDIPIPYGDVDCHVSASVGIAVSTWYNAPTAEDMFADADCALYTSKTAGRGRHTMFAAPGCPELNRRSAPP
ncbi:GGDEF domain-containing protein [Palleronia abyssalis]|uniref:Putative signaling protein n=1 Tax=Palleronia abyssalis TaxID=1501240 RepID=A0A2R8BYK9_9RHOB|nr:GGDEF domain-containing protein [Palleronia abyssalis]SPJ25251.1 putative signaling protein [Palleronia abyssalis]